jgi:hypothetical protein
MSGPQRALFQDLQQVLWTLLLMYLIPASTGFLFAQYIGARDALRVCLVIALLVAVTFASISLFDIVWIAFERRAGKRSRHGGE